MGETITLLTYFEHLFTQHGKRADWIHYVGVKPDPENPKSYTTERWPIFAALAQRINVKRTCASLIQLTHDSPEMDLYHLLQTLVLVGERWWFKIVPGITPPYFCYECVEMPHDFGNAAQFKAAFEDAIPDSEAWRDTMGGKS